MLRDLYFVAVWLGIAFCIVLFIANGDRAAGVVALLAILIEIGLWFRNRRMMAY